MRWFIRSHYLGSGLFGFALGLGFLTVVTSWMYYLFLGVAFSSVNPLDAAVAFASMGATRA
jgi:hypothetical protein